MMKITARLHSIVIRCLSLFMLIVTLFSFIPENAALAASSFKVGKATVTDSFIPHSQFNCSKTVGKGVHVCCWSGAVKAYSKIWGVSFKRNDSINLISNLSAKQRKLTIDNLKLFFGQAEPGAMFRMDKSTSTTSGDENGHSMIFLQLGKDGAYFYEANYNGKGNARVYYWTWKKLVSTYGSRYPYIKYISWPNAKKLVTSLSAPSVKANNVSNGIELSWAKVTNASSYTVYRNGTKLSSVSKTSYTDTTVKNGTAYTYTVKAHYKNISSNSSNSVKAAYLTAPSFKKTTAGNYRSGSYRINVEWVKNSAASGYEIQYSTSSNFSNSKTISINSAKTVKDQIVVYQKGTYYLRIRAVKGNVKSAWSGTVSVKVK